MTNWGNKFKTKNIDPENLIDHYNQYAQEFDEHVKNELCGNGENIPVVVTAKLFVETVPYQESMKILDVGAGTGEQGEQLVKLGYKNVELTAFDPSEGMLNMAKKRNIYSEFIQSYLPDTALASDYFDAIICVGTFTPGHAPAASLHELVRITKKGGYIVYSIRKHFYEDINSRFQAVEEELTQAKKWKMIAKREDEYLPLEKIKGYYFSFQVSRD